MELWLLNTFSTPALATVFIGGIVLFAVAGGLLVRRRMPHTVAGRHNETVGVVLGIYGAIYGIILAFVIVAEWEALGTARNNVATEATQTAEVLRDAAVFPPAQQRAVSSAIGAYVHAIVDKQWPRMREGHPDPNLTNPQVVALYRAFQTYEPTTEAQKAYYAQAVSNLGGVAAARRSRLATSQEQLPVLLTVLVLGGALVIIPLTWVYGIRSIRVQIVFVGAVAALIGVSVLLVLTLDRPFSGDLTIPPTPFKEGILAQFWR
ncbi:DUF4239 domain-containing protein [Streptomyces caatingaensis]|uniref:DUF4239 domain-containing protein n=1 Tax=Streptomyces caatingaensis TaxID=1678637 RepID=A0A0K9XBL6_9ACTN|nr:DUF4239 domain-containing protein [Streptomyces caatingaensis]KNB50794.1 hypothetical protein AC230_20330 [Streptomyces caatingaensis]